MGPVYICKKNNIQLEAVHIGFFWIFKPSILQTYTKDQMAFTHFKGMKVFEIDLCVEEVIKLVYREECKDFT